MGPVMNLSPVSNAPSSTGLSSIPIDPGPGLTTQRQLVEIPLDDLEADYEWNCRGHIAPVDVYELMESIEQRGLDTPVSITPTVGWATSKTGKKYRLIAGFRRYTAFTLLRKAHPDDPRFAKIPGIVKETSQENAELENFTENVQRQDLSILQEARGLKRLYDRGASLDSLSLRVGKPVRWLRARLDIFKLEPQIQESIGQGYLNIKQVEQCVRMPTSEKRFAFVRQVKEHMARGEQIKVGRKTKPITAKAVRDRAEMNVLMTWLYDNLGPSLATRIMAWSLGNISTADLFDDIKAILKLAGKENTRLPEI